MRGNTCEKGAYVCKSRGAERTDGLTEDSVWITEWGSQAASGFLK